MKVDLETVATSSYEPDAPHLRLARLAGAWSGSAKTFFEPGKPPLEAAFEGHVEAILGGRFARLTYRSRVEERPIAGELLVAYESGERRWTTAWVDSFHTGTAILVSSGEVDAEDIDVRGTYLAAPDQPRWGWRTRIVEAGDDALVVRMYNVSPDRHEDLGVEIELARV